MSAAFTVNPKQRWKTQAAAVRLMMDRQQEQHSQTEENGWMDGWMDESATMLKRKGNKENLT